MAREWKIKNHGRNARPDNEKLDCFGIPVANHESHDDQKKTIDKIHQVELGEFAVAFLSGTVELLIISYQSAYEDPDELGYMPGSVRNARGVFIFAKFLELIGCFA